MIFRSRHADVHIPDVPLHQFVLAQAQARGDKPALIDGPNGRTLTYAGLATGVERVAAGLAARGFRKGDVLALWAPNCPEFALLFFGTMAAGGIVTTLSPLATEDDATVQLGNAGARILVTVAAFLDRALPAARRAGVSELFVIDKAEDGTPFSVLLEHNEPMPSVSIDPSHDVCVLPYSSGTTGLCKGVMLTHRNLVANLCQTIVAWQPDAEDRSIAMLPFFHIYGMVVILGLGLWKGSTLITMPRFDLDLFLGHVQRHRITRVCVAPPVVLALAKHPSIDDFDLSSLKKLMSGAAPLDADLQNACQDRIGCVLLQGYGMTEASPVTHATSEEPGRCRPGTVGELVPNTECRIVDIATGQDLGPGHDGELWIRGPQVMKGYHDNPDATAATIDADGWLHTGDIGHADADGYFRVVDRLKELIKYKAWQVPPAELEAVLLTHPAVADAAVIGVPDAEAGELPKAFVVRKGEVTADELMAFVAAKVAPYKKVRAVEFIDVIPKSPSGKILRRLLRTSR